MEKLSFPVKLQRLRNILNSGVDLLTDIEADMVVLGSIASLVGSNPSKGATGVKRTRRSKEEIEADKAARGGNGGKV